MTTKIQRKNIFLILISLFVIAGMLLSGCSKSSAETTREKKKKNASKTEDTSEITEETETEATEKETTTEPDTSETTETLDPDRVRIAGTYEGFAIKTKAEAHPENGSVNNFPIIQEGRNFRLILNEDGTAGWEDDKEGNRTITEWKATGEDLSIVFSDISLSGVERNGVILVEDTDKYWYFISPSANVSSLWAITEAEAKVERGDDYLFARAGTELNLSEASKLYQEAPDAGCGKGWYKLGYMAQHYSLKEDHYKTALSYYQKASDAGSLYGLVGQGTLYEFGSGVDMDKDKAFSLYQQAAEGGCLQGYNRVASMYRLGTAPGLSAPSGNKAIELYQKALESPYWYEKAFSTNGIGLVYDRATSDTSKDDAKSAEWLTKASEMGYPSGYYNLAMNYKTGDGVPQDFVKARTLFNEAAARGDGDAYYQIGLLFEYGQGVQKTYDTAFKCFQKAAEYGNANAMYKMGRFYELGYGIEQSFTKTMDCYLVAAREKVPNAYGAIGYMFSEGEGGTKDDARALEWWLKGAELQDPQSTANVGWSYHYGHGVSIDYAKALEYYTLAMKYSKAQNSTHDIEYTTNAINKLLSEGHITQEQADKALAGG